MAPLWIGVGVFAVIAALLWATRGSGTANRSRATMADVQRLAQGGYKIDAIRAYREIHGVGLAEAKNAVESLCVGE